MANIEKQLLKTHNNGDDDDNNNSRWRCDGKSRWGGVWGFEPVKQGARNSAGPHTACSGTSTTCHRSQGPAGVYGGKNKCYSF